MKFFAINNDGKGLALSVFNTMACAFPPIVPLRPHLLPSEEKAWRSKHNTHKRPLCWMH
jgi:hypothetical protein